MQKSTKNKVSGSKRGYPLSYERSRKQTDGVFKRRKRKAKKGFAHIEGETGRFSSTLETVNLRRKGILKNSRKNLFEAVSQFL